MAESDSSPYSKEAMQKVVSSPAASRHKDPDYYLPRPQDFYASTDSNWNAVSSGEHAAATPASTLRIITWNIDFLIPFAQPRMEAALNYLESLVKASDIPTAIFLQEMILSDLQQIKEADWVQNSFLITDTCEQTWLSKGSFTYGTTTLVDRRLRVKSVFRVPVLSKFNRDGLFVDLVVDGHADSVVRLCNVHLESLPADPPVRDKQMADLKPYLHDLTVAAALLAGDCNAIEPFDRTLHTDNGLKDAYLELGGTEDDNEGCTWGFQDTKQIKGRFPPSRMDKLMYRGAVTPKRLERIGMGVSVEDEDVKGQMMETLGCNWVTDHYGLDITLELEEASKLVKANSSQASFMRYSESVEDSV